jgi:hypothetical protein
MRDGAIRYRLFFKIPVFVGCGLFFHFARVIWRDGSADDGGLKDLLKFPKEGSGMRLLWCNIPIPG